MSDRIPQIISLGAGVQSSTMALMAARGELLPMPIAAIFADTKAEPAGVYVWLEWLKRQLPFPVHVVTATGLSLEKQEMTVRRSAKSGRVYRKSMIPMFIEGRGILPRKCTRDHKITPILRKAKEIGNVPRRARGSAPYVIQWIGISTDEASRMKPSREPWAENRWPLIEAGMTRAACLAWMERNGFPRPPRSACIFCPYHNDAEWLRLKTEEPAEFRRAVDFESRVQAAAERDEVAQGVPFLHASRRPLGEVAFSEAKESMQANLWNNECEGMCGV